MRSENLTFREVTVSMPFKLLGLRPDFGPVPFVIDDQEVLRPLDDNCDSIGMFEEAMRRLVAFFKLLSLSTSLERSHIGAVTIRTILGRGFVDQDKFPLHFSLRHVALLAGNICVPACQRELRALIVVKRGWRPALIHMAIRAFGDSVLGRELAAVWIRMAGFAILGRSLELNVMSAGNGFVAVIAGRHAMRSTQRKFRFGMVEASNIDPGSGVVAGFAAQCRTVGALGGHAILEFALVGIGMASGASAVFEMERQNLVRPSGKAGLMAFRAGDGHVAPRQDETCLLVFGDGKCGAMKIFYRMTVFTSIQVGSGGKLLVVLILVAIGAGCELHFILSIFAGRCVTFVTSHCRMFSFQRIFRCCVFLHPE